MPFKQKIPEFEHALKLSGHLVDSFKLPGGKKKVAPHHGDRQNLAV